MLYYSLKLPIIEIYIFFFKARLRSKDDELIKTYSEIDKLIKYITSVKVKENVLKQAGERVWVLEVEAIAQSNGIVREKETLEVQIEQLKHKVDTSNVTLVSRDVELTMAYDIIDSLKQDSVVLGYSRVPKNWTRGQKYYRTGSRTARKSMQVLEPEPEPPWCLKSVLLFGPASLVK